MVTGDLTDSTNGNILAIQMGHIRPNGINTRVYSAQGVNGSFYFDIPGNHDAYNDQYFDYYLANSVQGRATGKTQASWIRTLAFGRQVPFSRRKHC